LSRNGADIFLLDVEMPQSSGLQVCQTIRASSETPVVLMSHNGKENEIIRGFEAGADDYVIKPFGIKHLVVRLQAILKRSHGQGAERTPHPLVVPHSSSIWTRST